MQDLATVYQFLRLAEGQIHFHFFDIIDHKFTFKARALKCT